MNNTVRAIPEPICPSKNQKTYPIAVPIGYIFDFERDYKDYIVKRGDAVFNRFSTDGADGVLDIYYINENGFNKLVKENEHSETDTGNS